MSQDQLNHAIRLIQAGKKEEARVMLLELIELEPYHVSIWMWLAETMPSDEQRIEILKTCLKLNPDSMMAKRGLQRFLESQKLKRRSSIETAPTVPLPSPSSPGPSTPVSEQQTAKPGATRGVESAQLRSRLTAAPNVPANPQQAENIPAFRDEMLGNKKLPKVEPWSTIADKLKPTTSEVGKRPSISEKNAEPTFPRGSRASMGKKQVNTNFGKFRRNRWVVLGVLGILAVVTVAVVGVLLRDPIRQVLGLERETAIPASNTIQPTPGALGTILITQTQATQVESPDSTPTLSGLPAQVITTSIGYSFPNPVIVPEMEKPIKKLVELFASPARSLAFSPDNRLLATGMQDGTVYIWDLATRNVVQILQGHTKAVNAVGFSPDAYYIISGSEDGTVQTWNLATLELLKLINRPTAVTSVAFSPNGTTYALGSLDGTIMLWNVGATDPAATLTVGNGVTALGFSPDGVWLAYGTNSGEITLWNTFTSGEQKTTKVHSEAVNSLQFSPDGARFASGSADKSVKLWDTASGKVLFTVGSHTDSVESVSFSPDGRLLASAELGHTIKIWDIDNRKEVVSLAHAQRMPGVAFSPDGRILASTLLPIEDESDEGGVALWGVPVSQDISKSPARLDLDALKAGIWSTGGSMLLARAAHKMVEVTSDQYLIIDGVMQASQASDPDILAHQAEVYSISEDTSSFTSPMNIDLGALSSTSATHLWDGRVLVISGYNGSQTGKTNAEIYNPANGIWSLTNPLFNHGSLHTATLLSDGRVLVVGGCNLEDGESFSERVELFDPLTNTWTETVSLPEPRCDHTSTLLPNGHVLIAGGYGSTGELFSSALTYNPNINQWVMVGSMTTSRADATAVLLTNGRVLVAGGLALSSGSTITIKSVEIYDPDTGVWVSVEPMTQSRYGHTTTRLSSGLVMVTGGVQITSDGNKRLLADVEVYDLVSENWSVIAPLLMPRAFHVALFLSDGRLLVMGGMDSQEVPQAGSEIFVPK